MWSTSRTSASSSIDVPGLGVLEQQLAHRVRDLLPSAVADRDVELHARPVLGAGGRGGQPLGHRRRGSRSSAPTTRSRHGAPGPVSSSTTSAMISSSGSSSSAGRVRLSVDSRNSVTTSTPASSHQRQQVRDLGRAHPVTGVDVAEALLAGPAPVAVEHEGDVPGSLDVGQGQFATDPALVHRVQEVPYAHGRSAYAAAPHSLAARSTPRARCDIGSFATLGHERRPERPTARHGCRNVARVTTGETTGSAPLPALAEAPHAGVVALLVVRRVDRGLRHADRGVGGPGRGGRGGCHGRLQRHRARPVRHQRALPPPHLATHRAAAR